MKSHDSGAAAERSPSEAQAHERAPEGLVALVYCGLQGSSELWEKVPGVMTVVLERYQAVLRRLIRRHVGYEALEVGDAFFVVFPDPLRAVRWCLDVQVALAKEIWPPEVHRINSAAGGAEPSGVKARIGVHMGDPQRQTHPVTGRVSFVGPATLRAARIADLARGGETLVSERVWEAVAGLLRAELVARDLGEVRLKGLEQPERLAVVFPKSLPHPDLASLELRFHVEAPPAQAVAPPELPSPRRPRPSSLDGLRDAMVLALCIFVLLCEIYIMLRFAPGDLMGDLSTRISRSTDLLRAQWPRMPRAEDDGSAFLPDSESEYTVPLLNPIEDAFLEDPKRERLKRAGIE